VNKINFNTLIFDLDGTLVDTVQDVMSGINHALNLLGLSMISLKKAKEMIGPGKDAFLRAVMPGNDTSKDERFLCLFRDYYWEHCLDHTTLFPGMKNILDNSNGMRLAIASNKPRYFIERILQGLNVADRFDAIVGPDDVVHAKPHPEMIIKILKQIKGKSANTLFVGDTEKDMQAGRGAGVKCCAACYGYGNVNHMRRQNPDYFINNPGDLEKIICNHHR
jgi:phosphoglycolate phosphatase